MHLKRLYQTVTGSIALVVFYLIDIRDMVPGRAPKKCIIQYYRPNQRLCLQSAIYKFCNHTLFIRLLRKIKNINNISLKFIMLTDNNQIFRNCFVFIYCHLTKVSSQINKCIIFEPNKLSKHYLLYGLITLQQYVYCGTLRFVDLCLIQRTRVYIVLLEVSYCISHMQLRSSMQYASNNRPGDSNVSM